MSARQPRLTSRNGAGTAASRNPQPRGGASDEAAGHPAAISTAVVADVNPTYTISGSVRCAETVNDRIAWTAEGDGTLKVRSLPKGTELKVLPGRPRTQCSALLFMEPQRQIWAAFEDGYVRVYSVLQTEMDAEFCATETPGAAVTALLEVEGMVFVAGDDGGITQWDGQSLQRLRALPGHGSAVRCLGCYMGPTGSVLFSGSDDSTVKAWDPYVGDDAEGDASATKEGVEGPCMFTFQGHTTGSVRAIEVVNFANQMWTAGSDKTVRVWNLETLDCVAVLKGHTAPVTSLLCIESRMWSGDAAGHVMLWDINSCTPLQELSGKMAEAGRGGGTIVAMKKMQPSTSWKVWTATANGPVQCWNAETVPILFHPRKKATPAGKAAGSGGRGAATVDEDDEEVQAWRRFQKTVTDEAQPRPQEANADGRRPSLGIVDIQRLADELGYERGRMEVQRELQTQQLLEEENAQLKTRVKALQRQLGVQEGQRADGAAVSTPAAAAPPSAVLPADGSVDPRDVRTTHLTRTLPGNDWSYIMRERPHELRETALSETSTALGIPSSHITHIAFAKGSLVLDVDVQHHKSMPAADMQRRLESHSFAGLAEMHEKARSTPKSGLDAAEANLCVLEQKLQDVTEANQQLQEELQAMQRGSSASRGSPEPHRPSHNELASVRQQRDSLAEELQHLREENEALERLLERAEKARAPSADEDAKNRNNYTKDQQYEQLLSLKDAELRRLQDQLAAERDSTANMKAFAADLERQRDTLDRQLADLQKQSNTSHNQSLSHHKDASLKPQRPALRGDRGVSSEPSMSEDRPSLELSPSPPAIDRTSNKAARPYSLQIGPQRTAAKRDTSDDNAFRSPSQDGLLTPSSGLPSFGPFNGISQKPTESRNGTDELHKLSQEHAQLVEEYEALNNYVQDGLKPLVARLKRGRAELGMDVERLKKEKAELQRELAAAKAKSASVDPRQQSVESASSSGARQHNPSHQNDDVESLTRSQTAPSAEELMSIRRDLLKAQADATAKGTALRQVQREMEVLKRAMEKEGQGEAGAEASSRSPSMDRRAAERTASDKDAELQQLRDDYERLSAHVNEELKPEMEKLRQAVADREAQLQKWQQDASKTRDDDNHEEAADALVHSARPSASKPSPLQESSLSGRATQPAYVDEGMNGSRGVEAQNLALSVRLADAETVIRELQTSLEKTSAQLAAQQRETDRLMNLVADMQMNDGVEDQ